MSIFTPFSNEPQLCKTCTNRGYYVLQVQPERAKDSQVRTIAFCACEAGQQLVQISKESRLNDLNAFGRPLLQALRECENKWHKNRDEAKGALRKTILGLEKMIQELEDQVEKRSDNNEIKTA